METDTTNKRFLRYVLIIAGMMLSLLLICGGSLYMLRFHRCIFDCAPARSFDVDDLGIPLDYFPPGSQYNLPMGFVRSHDGTVVRKASMGITWENYPDAALNAYRFWTEGDSRDYFSTAAAAAVNRSDFRPYSQIQFASEIADEYLLGCGVSEFGGFRCNVIIRYDEFVIKLSSDVDDSIMTSEYFNRAIEYIDDQMAAHLGEDK